MIDYLKTIDDKNVEKMAGKNEADKDIFEKFTMSLLLLEQLESILSNYNFVFKGGTSLLLLFKDSSRFSIDIDISMKEELYGHQDTLLNLFKDNIKKPFINVTLDPNRKHGGRDIKCSHYRFEYVPKYKASEQNILLDVVFQNSIIKSSLINVDNPRIIQNGVPKTINTIDVDDLLGDKLTAFAPNTIGIKYSDKNHRGRNKSCEIIKQLYDCHYLSTKYSNINRVAEVYVNISNMQIKYERRRDLTPIKCLYDTIHTSILLISKGKSGSKDNYNQIIEGISSFNNFKIGEKINIVDIQKMSMNVAILSGKILSTVSNSVHYIDKLDFIVENGLNEKELELLFDDSILKDF